MTKQHVWGAPAFAIVSTGWGLLLMSTSSAGQPQMSREEAAQLYAAAGFPISNNQPVNRCGKPAKPRVKFVDISGDKLPEALIIDTDVQCYAPSGRYFAVLTRQGTTWRPIASGTGSIEALPTKTSGWIDMRVTDAGCTREHRYDGRAYRPATKCAGEALATAPVANQSAPPSRQPAAKPSQAPAVATQEAAPRPAGAATAKKLEAADEAAAFKAAGFKKRGKVWRNCEEAGSASDSPAGIESVADLNGDGLPDAVLVEGGTACYGMTGQGFWLVSKRADGSWKLMTGGPGVPEVLKTKGVDGWPDVSIGGPGFCFPVERWNGREYKVQRWEYEGKACKPPR